MVRDKERAPNPPGDILAKQRDLVQAAERDLVGGAADRERELLEYVQRRGYSEEKRRELSAKREQNAAAFLEKHRALLVRMEQGEEAAIAEQRMFFEVVASGEAGIAEADRREGIVTDEAGNRHALPFDGLLGQLPEGASRLLQDIVRDLRDYLLDKYSNEKVRHLLTVFEPQPGFRSMPVIPDDVDLAIRLLNNIRGAMRCEGEHFTTLILGPVGVRDEKRQAGTREAGRTTGEQRRAEAEQRYEGWRREAYLLIQSGERDQRNVASILAKRHGVAASTIRRGISKARNKTRTS